MSWRLRGEKSSWCSWCLGGEELFWSFLLSRLRALSGWQHRLGDLADDVTRRDVALLDPARAFRRRVKDQVRDLGRLSAVKPREGDGDGPHRARRLQALHDVRRVPAGRKPEGDVSLSRV